MVVFAPTHDAIASSGWEAFKRGEFYEARSAGRTQGDAEGLSLACRAGLVLGGFTETDEAAIRSLHGAIRDCDKALKLVPEHYFAKMSLAIALSFEGKRLKRPSYPARARSYLLELIEAEPNNPLGYGALGAWHSEVSAAGFFARITLGARRKKASLNFEQALLLGGTDYALRFEHVKFLARGNKADRKKALDLAQSLLKNDTDMAFDLLLKRRCSQLVEALKLDNKRVVRAAVAKAAAFQNAIPEREMSRFPLDDLIPVKTK